MSREPDCPLHASCTSLSETRSHTWAPIRPPPPGAIQVSRDVPYISSAGPYRRGDLYLPQKRTKARSAVIIVHGPDWSTGRKGTPGTARIALALARHGYLAFDVDYRPVGHAGGFPRAIRDVKAAAAYLSVNAAALHVDPAKIAVIGAGSGGYLAMMAADTPNQPPFMPRDYTASEIHLAAVASFFAPTDLTASSDPAEIAAIAAFLRAGKLTPATAGPAQPLTYASRAVPTIFFYGRQNRANPFAPIFRLYRAIKRRSIPAQLIEVHGAPRAFADLTGAERSSAIRQLELFLDGVLYNQTQQ